MTLARILWTTSETCLQRRRWVGHRTKRWSPLVATATLIYPPPLTERLDMFDEIRRLIQERDELACAINAGYATQCQGELEAMTRKINTLLKG